MNNRHEEDGMGFGFLSAEAGDKHERKTISFTDPEKLFTKRGISRPDLDRLHAAIEVLSDLHNEICDVMREGGLGSASNSPDHIVQDVRIAISTLVNEPVNTKADWKSAKQTA